MVVASVGPAGAAGLDGGATGCWAKAAENAIKPRMETMVRRVFILNSRSLLNTES